MFFANKKRKDRNVDLKSLVSLLLVKYAKILGEIGNLFNYSKNVYNLIEIQSVNNFSICYKNPKKTIFNVINNYIKIVIVTRTNQVIENWARLKPII